ncbi:MAG: adenylate/guanylate cyclase domain-containing protein [Leptolyngbyaceae cyanobacterium bins.59]|nr:adenylate/guanylate cyclase domain-containing protein [Leptolyngbyaceae cyanobacterium bins.59]
MRTARPKSDRTRGPYLLRVWMRLLKDPEVNLGETSYETWRHRFLRDRLLLVLLMAAIGYLTFVGLEISLVLQDQTRLRSGWLLLAALIETILFSCLGLYNAPFGRRYPEVLFLACSWSITLLEQIWATLNGRVLFGFVSWTLVFLTQATLMPVRWSLHLISQLGVLAYYFGVNPILGLKENQDIAFETRYALFLFWFCLVCNLSVYLYERLQRSEFEARQKLQAEQAKSEKLLLNILPETIAHQLKHQQGTIADSFPEVSVLFADIVGFTKLSTRIDPIALVNLLNQIFSTFDELAEHHQLEKIKTIGDAYMVVGGLPREREDHAEAIAEMALDMQKALTTFNAQQKQNFQIRIGINTGPVVAGVIGIKKFIYDLWGDTVNTASRMESHGVPDCIHVTAATYERLRDRYQFEQRGAIEVKGKGLMTTYFLVGRGVPVGVD